MDFQDVLNLLSRWAHILAAMTAAGGTVFARFVVVPTLDGLPADQRAGLHAAMRARWSKIVAAAIGFLLVTGLYNIMFISVEYRLPRWYNPLFALKLLAALVIFGVASLLAGKTPAAEQIRRHARFWLNLNLALVMLVVLVSGILRTAEKIPKRNAAAPAISEPDMPSQPS